MRNFKNTLWGVVLILIGIIFALNAFNVTNINIFFKGWWTLFIIVPCFIDLFTKKDDEFTGNIIGIIVGVLLLLAVRDIIDFELILKLLVPIILILIGLSFIFKDRIRNIKIPKNNSDSEYFGTFSYQEINDITNFSGTSLNAIFGGIKLDLRNSKIKKDSVIKASAIFGGITIIVPEDYQVVVKSSSIFGGVDNKCNKNDGTKNIIYVDALCLFGGISINERDTEDN